MSSSNDAAASRRRDEEEDVDHERPSENTPLLSQDDDALDQSQPQREQSAESLLRHITNGNSKSSRIRWPSILALVVLCIMAILIMVFAFLAPIVVEEYATKAIVFEPTSMGIESFTSSGVRARIRGTFGMDASRVDKRAIRDFGRFGTWFAREAETGEAYVEVSLPEYGNIVLGTAAVPPIKVDVRNGHRTGVDFVTDLTPGDKEGIRRIANDWIEGRLGQLRVLGKARVPVKSGILSLGTQTVEQEMTFAKNDVPAVPKYDIESLAFMDAKDAGMEADVSLSVENKYPVDIELPSIGFEILMQDCKADDPYISVATAATSAMHVRPKEDLEVDVEGFIRRLPPPLTKDCPGSDLSPLDIFLGRYIRGKGNKVYVRGAQAQKDLPQWVTDLTKDILVPLPLPGKSMGHLIKNFSLTDTNFNLPDPFSDPNKPESNPRISARIKALIAIPEEMNFNITTNRIRADADVFYKGEKLGNLDLHKWQPANSTRVAATGDDGPILIVESQVDKAPLNITDEQVFADVIQNLVFGGKAVNLQIKAEVDVQVETALGKLKLTRIPAEGQVPVKPIEGGNLGDGTSLKISDLQITETTSTGLTLSALVNLTNPTEYSATVPYVDIHLVKNGSILGHATARDIHVQPGQNDNLLVQAVYAPLDYGGPEARAIGTELLSQYISGFNTTLTLQTHNGTIPSQPALGEALSKFAIEVPTPHLSVPRKPSDPNDPNGTPDDETHFIDDATMHLFTSTATFTLLSPLRHSTIYIEHIDATAMYKGDDVGHITYDMPFAVPPIDKDGKGVMSPRLPVDWSLGSAGYDAIRDALGGTLKLSADAVVGIRLEKFRETIWFKGKSIGAHIRV